MFEQQLTDLLASYLGRVLDIQQDQLKVNVWTAWKTGLSLEDVPLRKDVALLPLTSGGDGGFPLTLLGGNIGNMQVAIPWGSLMMKSSPIVVSLCDLEIVLGINEELSFDKACERYVLEKALLLASQQLQNIARSSLDPQTPSSSHNGSTVTSSVLYSFTKHALSLVLGRLNVNLQNISIRIINMTSGQDLVRLMIDSIQTVDKSLRFSLENAGRFCISEKGISIVDMADAVLRQGSAKNFQFSGIQVCWSPLEKDLEEPIATLLETDFHVKVLYDITSNPSQVLVTAEFEKMRAHVDASKLEKVFHVMEELEWKSARYRVAHIKAKCMGDTTHFNAKKMWKFAVNSVLLKLQGSLKFSIWKPEIDRVHDRRRYILLYRKKIERESNGSTYQPLEMSEIQQSDFESGIRESSVLSVVGEKQISLLEDSMSVSDILACRAAVKKSLLRRNSSEPAFELLGMNSSNRDGSIATESSWVKMPSLSDMEDLFRAVEFTPQEEDKGAGLPIQVLAMVNLPYFSCSVAGCLTMLNIDMSLKDLAFGFVSDYEGHSYAMGTIGDVQMHTGLDSNLCPYIDMETTDGNLGNDSFISIQYSSLSKRMSVDISRGMMINLVPEDVGNIIDCIPMQSPEAYSIHWVRSAVSMEQNAYCIETMQRLQTLGSFIDFNISLGPTKIRLNDMEMCLESLAVKTLMESENFEELQQLHRTLSSMVQSGPRLVDTGSIIQSSINSLEDRLLYKEIDLSLGVLSVTHRKVPVLFPVDASMKFKMNRLAGDFVHPQAIFQLYLGSVSLDLCDNVLESFADIQSKVFPKQQHAVDDEQETIHVEVVWSKIAARWLDNLMRHQFSIHADEGRVETRMSLPTSQTILANIQGIQVVHTEGMENIAIPLARVQIPYFARIISLEKFVLDLEQRYSSKKMHAKVTGLNLVGDGKDKSNFIASSDPHQRNKSLIEVKMVECTGERTNLDINLANIEIGQGTLMRAYIIPKMFSTNIPESDPYQQDRYLFISINMCIQNLKFVFMHDKLHGGQTGLPVQYQDFSDIHPTIASVGLSKLDFACDISDTPSIKMLALTNLIADCGMLSSAKIGASLVPILSIPQIQCESRESDVLLHVNVVDLVIRPYQMMLLKGILDLIHFDQMQLMDFYGIPNDVINTKDQAPHERKDFDFNPLSLSLDKLNVTLVGPTQMSGGLYLYGQALTLDATPKSLQTSWEILDLYFVKSSHDVGDYDGACRSCSYTLSSGSECASCSSPGMSNGDSSSQFFDAASVGSKAASDNSYISCYYSIQEEDIGSSKVSAADSFNMMGHVPSGDDSMHSIVKIRVNSLERDLQEKAVTLCFSGKSAKLDLSPLELRFAVDDLPLVSKVITMYHIYFSNHLGSVTHSRQVSHTTETNFGFLRDLEMNIKDVTVIFESHGCVDVDTLSDDIINTFSNKERNDIAALVLKFALVARVGIGNFGYKVDVKIPGLLVSALETGTLSKANLVKSGIIGVRDLDGHYSILNKRQTESILKSDVVCQQLSIWLTDENINSAKHMIKVLQKISKKVQDDVLKAEDDTNDLLLPLPKQDDIQATIVLSLKTISTAVGSRTLSNEMRYIMEINSGDLSLMTHYRQGSVHASASTWVDIGVTNPDGQWLDVLDKSEIKIHLVVPCQVIRTSDRPEDDATHLDINFGDVDFTLSSHVINALTLSKLILVTLPDTDRSSIAKYLNHNQISNETEFEFTVQLRSEIDEGIETFILTPGGKAYPKHDWTPNRSGLPDPVSGVMMSHKSSIAANPSNRFIYFKMGTSDAVQGPMSLDKANSQRISGSVSGEHCIMTAQIMKSSDLTWSMFIRPSIKLWNNSSFRISLSSSIPGSINDTDQTTRIVTSLPGSELWLPASMGAGTYRIKIHIENFAAGIDSTGCLGGSWSGPISLTEEMLYSKNCLQKDFTSGVETEAVAMVLKIVGYGNYASFIISPKVVFRNFMPTPITLSSNMLTQSLEPLSHQSISKFHRFPLHLRVEPSGYYQSSSVTVNEINGIPSVRWTDQLTGYSSSLDLNFVEISSSKSEMYAKLDLSVDKVSGSVVLTFQCAVWIYNFTGLPLSMDCLLSEDSIEQINDSLDDSNDAVPESWISPLELTKSKAALVSSRSQQSSIHLSENSWGGQFELDRSIDTRRKMDPLHESHLDGAASSSFQGSHLGLGSIALDEDEVLQDNLSISRVQHRLKSLDYSDVARSNLFKSTWPTGPNHYGASILEKPVKTMRLRFSKQRAKAGSTYWSPHVLLRSQRQWEVSEVPIPSLSSLNPGTEMQGAFPVSIGVQDIIEGNSDNIIEKLVVSPRFIIINQLEIPIHYKQLGAHVEVLVPPGDYSAVQWVNINLSRKLSVRIQEAGWMWSGGFSLEHAGDVFLKLRHRDRGITRVVRADLSQSSDDGSRRIVFRSNPEDFTPYRLDNCSLETLTVRQKDVIDQQDILRPYCSLNYTWDEPSLPHKVTIESPGGMLIGTFNLDRVGFETSVSYKDRFSDRKNHLAISIHSEGPLRVLTVMDKEYHRSGILSNVALDQELAGVFEFKCVFNSISASFMHNGHEKLFLSLRQLELSCLVGSSRISLSGALCSLQLENPSYHCVYPVVFSLPAPESKLTSRVRKGVEPRGGIRPFKLDVVLWRKGPENKIVCFELAELHLRSVALYIEQDLMNLLQEMSDAGRSLILLEKDAKPSVPSTKAQSFLDLSSLSLSNEITESQKYYFDHICVSPIEVNVSFNSCLSGEHSSIILQQIISLADIEDARLWLTGISLENSLFDEHTISSYLSGHYRRALILELFKLVGAANVLGDPMALLHHVGLGFWQFVSFPAVGLFESVKNMGPEGLVMGFVSGTKGLLQNVLFAVSNATTKASTAAHKAISLWGYGDNEIVQGIYIRSRDMSWADNHRGESLVGAVLRGVIGLVTDPIQGAEYGGFTGFITGIRHGILGSILIPTSAWLQMCASTALSIRRAVAGSANVGWSRPPRWTLTGIESYDRTESMGRWLFHQIQSRNIFLGFNTSDQYLICTKISCLKQDEERYIILTNRNILVVSAYGPHWIPRIIWRSRLLDIEAVTLRGKELVITSDPPLLKIKPMRVQEDTHRLFSVFIATCETEKELVVLYKRLMDEWEAFRTDKFYYRTKFDT